MNKNNGTWNELFIIKTIICEENPNDLGIIWDNTIQNATNIRYVKEP